MGYYARIDEMTKTLNRRYGMQLLKKMNEDLIIRFGGDEFLIVFENRSIEEAELIWLKVLEVLSSVRLLKNEDFLIWASQ